ncbi:ubiquitin-protein ligase E3B-like [Procambarus clarkii]|uniref:ubiquitin-protein ligase E3B-like n=1 Tax=Procambarus clarkii TaxID=6728 RepID=UPI003744A5B8
MSSFRQFVVKRLLEKCGEYVTTKQSSLTQWHPVLGWFSRPLDQHLNESLTLVKSQLQLLWSSSIIKVMFSYLSNVVDQEPSQSDSNVNSGNAASSAASSFSNIGSFAPSNFLKKALDRKLCSTVTGGSLRSGGLRGGGCRKLGSPTVSTVAMVCSMYHTAITTLSQLRMDILTGLCYKSEMVPQLWHILLSLGPSCGIKSYLDLLSVSTKATAPEFHLLILFCDATTHVVTVLDDLEMYEQQKPFSLVDYSTMASFLNNFTYKIINNGLVDVRSVQSSALFVSVHTLLMLLYKRNSRRSYVPDTHWLIKEVRVSTFMAELERGKRTAQVLMQKMPHIIPHTERVLLFRKHVNNEKAVLGLTDAACATPHSTLITIHRRTPNLRRPQTPTETEKEDPQTLTETEKEDPQTLTETEKEDPQTLTETEKEDPQTLTETEKEDPQTLTETEDRQRQRKRTHRGPTETEKEDPQTPTETEKEDPQTEQRGMRIKYLEDGDDSDGDDSDGDEKDGGDPDDDNDSNNNNNIKTIVGTVK